MFEQYTEEARRVIFFARYEASQFGVVTIETEHLLMGLLREDKGLMNHFLKQSGSSVEKIRKEIEGRAIVRERTKTSIDLPLSAQCKRILAFARDEVAELEHRHIDRGHLLLGILREDCVAAEILSAHDFQLLKVRAYVVQRTANPQVEEAELGEEKETYPLADLTPGQVLLLDELGKLKRRLDDLEGKLEGK